ncbi:carboxy-S-adenosyl-L-methionine synthase CmoA [Candidatus Pantoea edessiphila]|uniref:Carboxy-S-adenosyl-L-methionine synthase n=1 Tax=Candidatus Pantoea edessiphila TaxID=2044610 RepID=A0A2P5T0S7_9GAMM|nr:carboxy-S-adenosyl-L-methionine synthase CmoA [Candidatus Pantoea edessiphila]PPI88194.1 carboxy-S-adenosyl-L-methionine synthase CmoA [Candidatus Pantoea edessiphila]
MSNRDTLYSTPIEKIGDWVFDEKIAKVFPDMIQRSIPGYSIIISMIGTLSKSFVTSNSNIYDLGCSLGAVTLSVCYNIIASNCTIIAVDKSSDMIKNCQSHIDSIKSKNTIIVMEADILDVNIENASMVVLNFTLQFLKPSTRLKLIKKIWQGLNPCGILILSEKINFKDNKINELISNMHYNFKIANDYSTLQIHQKNKMLENVMFTDSIKTHKNRLKQAGFSHVEVWFQCFNFCSLIALK